MRQRPRYQRRPVATLTATERERLFAFADRYSARHTRRFLDALEHQQEVVFVEASGTGHLVGFVVYSVFEPVVDGETHTVIYTHWAMFNPAWRNQYLVARVGIRAFFREKARHPLRRTYWMFTASSVASYLVMARNFPVCWPLDGHPFPPRERSIVEQVLAAMLSTWDPTTGVIHRRGASAYREAFAPDPDRIDRHMRFYLAANPGVAEGDTLPCLAPLDLRSWSAIVRRAVGRARGRRGA